MEVLALKGAAFVGQACFTSLIGDIYGLVRDNTLSIPVVQRVLEDLDLYADLELIESVVSRLENLEIGDSHSPVRIALNHVEEGVHSIKKELEELSKVAERHRLKWFASWRSPNYDRHLKQLTRYKKILDIRIARLIELVKIHELSLK